MSDETSPPFSGFRNARPARKTPAEQAESAHADAAGELFDDPPKRKRRTRAEIEATGRPRPSQIAVITQCIKALRTLDSEDANEAVRIMTAIFT